jgi:hypothetical protein
MANVGTSTVAYATQQPTGSLVFIASDGTACVLWHDGTNQKFSYSSSPYSSWTTTTLITGLNMALGGKFRAGSDNIDVVSGGSANVRGNYFPLTKIGATYSLGTSNVITGTTAIGTTAVGNVMSYAGQDPQGRHWIVVGGASTYTAETGYFSPANSPTSTGWTASPTTAVAQTGDVNLPAGDQIGNFILRIWWNGTALQYSRADNSAASVGAWATAATIPNLTGSPNASSRVVFRALSSTQALLVYSTASGIYAQTYNPATNTFSTATQLSTNASDRHPTIVTNKEGDAWVLWCSFAAANSYALVYKKWNGSAWDGSATTLVASGTNIANPNAGWGAGGTAGVTYTVGTANPFTVGWATFSTIITSTRTIPATAVLSREAWFNSAYHHKKQITIPHASVSGGSDLSSFPLLISMTDADLKSVANGGNVQNGSGFDIIFTNNQETAKLDHEIERYIATTGEIEMWVRIPTLSVSQDTALFLYYDNSAISTSQENKTGVWDSNFKGVYHLGNGTTLSAVDSTSNANNGTNSGVTATAGQIDGGGNFNGSSYITLPSTGLPTAANPWTMQNWLQIAANPSTTPTVITFAGNVGALYLTNTSVLHGYTGVDITGSALTLSSQHQMALTYDGTTLTLYQDGVVVASTTTTPNVPAGGGAIGANTDTTHPVTAIIDEVRISSVARSASWIATEYSNQSSPGTFQSVAGTRTGERVIAASASVGSATTRIVLATCALLATKTRTIPTVLRLSVSSSGMIVDPAGTVVHLRGLNTAGLEFGDGLSDITQARINALARVFSMNLWRLAINVSWWNNNVLMTDGVTHYQAWIQQVIGWMKAAGCYVEIDPTTYVTIPPNNSSAYCNTFGNPPESVVASDTFTRANNASSWGTASDGKTWTNLGAAATLSIASNEGVLAGSGSSNVFMRLGSGTASDQFALVRFSRTQTTLLYSGITLRFTDANNWYLCYVGSSQIFIDKTVGGTYTNLASASKTFTNGTFYWLRAEVIGTTLHVRAWADGSTEPTTWDIAITDSALASGGYGLFGQMNTSDSIQFDTFSVKTPVTVCITSQDTLNNPPWTDAQIISATNTFYDSFIPLYQNDNALLYDAINEPRYVPAVTDPTTVSNAIINHIQTLAPNALIFVYGDGTDALPLSDIYPQSNLVWDYHIYDDVSWTWQNKLTYWQSVWDYAHTNHHAVSVGEWNAGTTNDPNGFGEAIANLSSVQGIGNTYYYEGNLLLGDNTTLTAEGVITQAVFQIIASGSDGRIIPTTVTLGIPASARTIPASGALLASPTRTVSTTVALIATRTRTMAASGALLASITRSIPLSAAVIATRTRTVIASGALIATSTRTLPNTTPLLNTSTRTILTSGALLKQASRSIPMSAALSITRIVPTSGALSLTSARTLGASSALVLTQTRQAGVSSALLATTTRSVPITSALIGQVSRSIPATGALSITRIIPTSAAFLLASSRSIPASTALLSTRTRTISSSVALLSTFSRVGALSTALLASLSRSIGASAALIGTRTRTITTDAALSLTGTTTRTIPVTGVLIATRSRSIGTSAALGLSNLNRTVPTSVAFLSQASRGVSVTSALIQQANRDIGASTPLQVTASRQVTASVALISQASRSIPLDAALIATLTRTSSETVALIATLSRTLSTDVALTLPGSHFRGIPCSATLSGGSRVIPVTLALKGTQTSSIPCAVSISLPIQGLQIGIPASTALQSTSTRFVVCMVALLASNATVRFRSGVADVRVRSGTANIIIK